jgi:hypothetical protein
MKKHSDDMTKLHQILQETYRQQPILQPGPFWQARVMAKIQEMAEQAPVSATGFFWPDILWRLTPLTCLLIVILSIMGLNLLSRSEFALMNFMLDQPMAFSLTTILGM